MEICKLILHIMDTKQNIFVPSDIEINQINDEILPQIESKLKKIFTSSNRKKAQFVNSPIEKMIFDYKTENLTFQQLSVQIAQIIFEEKRKLNIFHTSDFLLAEVKFDDIRYLIGIDNANSYKLTHTTQTIQNQIQNEIILYKTLFSNNLTKDDRVFLIEYANSSLQIIENPYVSQTNKIYVFEEILQCHAQHSYKETMDLLNMTVEALSNKYHLDTMQTISSLKSLIKDNVENDETIETDEIAQMLFDEHPLAKSEFLEQIKENQIPPSISLENVKQAKKDKTQKIKTSNGIEITIPVEYMNQKDIVEFITEHDGTISIRLKNIESITQN